jgi:hypothetical protein
MNSTLRRFEPNIFFNIHGIYSLVFLLVAIGKVPVMSYSAMKCSTPTNTAMYHGYDCSVLPRIREIQTAYPWNASC